MIALSTVELPDGPPAASSFGEIRALREPARLARRSRRLVAAPRGDGPVVIVVPGFRTGDRATAPLRAYLRRLGYDARGWGLGINRGHPESDRDRLAAIVRDVATEHGPVGLVGWSLGLVIVREVARELPDHVDGVVLFGGRRVGRLDALATTIRPGCGQFCGSRAARPSGRLAGVC